MALRAKVEAHGMSSFIAPAKVLTGEASELRKSTPSPEREPCPKTVGPWASSDKVRGGESLAAGNLLSRGPTGTVSLKVSLRASGQVCWAFFPIGVWIVVFPSSR